MLQGIALIVGLQVSSKYLMCIGGRLMRPIWTDWFWNFVRNYTPVSDGRRLIRLKLVTWHSCREYEQRRCKLDSLAAIWFTSMDGCQ